MMDGFDSARQISGRVDMLSKLLREADDAFHSADRNCCIDVIEKIYELLDEGMD